MPDYGFKGIGDSGAWQIDGLAANLSMVAKGSFYTDQTLYPNTTFDPNNPNQQYSPEYNFRKFSVSGLVAPVLATEGTASIGAIEVTGNTWTWWIYGDSGGGFTYFLFDVAPPDQGGYGIRVINDANSLIYSGNSKPLRIVNRFTIDYGGNTTTERSWGTLTDNQVRRLAFVQVAPPPSAYRQEYGFFYPTATVWFRGTWIQYSTSLFNPIAFGYNSPSQSSSADTVMGVFDADTGMDPNNPFYIPGSYTLSYDGNWDFWVVDVTNY